MKVLITGGAGFIGSRLAEALHGRGHEVTILDSLTPQIHGENADFPEGLTRVARCIRGDVRNIPEVEAVLDGMDCVVHYAAETGMGQSQYEIHRYFDVNVGGTAALLQAIANRQHKVKRLILSSSARIYGEGPFLCPEHGRLIPQTRPLEQMAREDWEMRCPLCGVEMVPAPCLEDDEPSPGSMYAVTKVSQEQMISLFSRLYGVEAVIFRYQNVYGAGQALRNPYTGVVSVFCNRLRNNLAPEIYEDGVESRDFVYVTDIVAATVQGIERPGLGGEVINVGSGDRASILRMARAVVKSFGSSLEPVLSGRYRSGEVRHMVADISKARNLLGYEPQVDLEQGIGLLVDWVRSQPVFEDLSVKALGELSQRGLSGTVGTGR